MRHSKWQERHVDWAIVALELLALEAALVTAKGLVRVCVFFLGPLDSFIQVRRRSPSTCCHAAQCHHHLDVRVMLNGT